MVEPAKPFACSMPECGMSFTNEDHLHVHTKKHDMVLQLGLEQKAAFVADQTPTPTRFIRNCEEVGLFQDLQNVAANPFDEGFKRAMEAKHGILCLDSAMTPSDDVLHTPQMFPLLDTGESVLFTNNQRNITISRSSSDESGTIKEFETRTVSKLTNEVTTISRIVTSDDLTIKQTDIQKDIETVSYKNNVIKIASNVIRKEEAKAPVLIYSDSVIKDATVTTSVNKEITDNNKLEVDKVPIMSQKSIDFVVESLTKELTPNVNNKVQNDKQTTEVAKQNVLKKIIPSLLKKPESMTIKKQPKLLPKKVEIKTEPEDDYEVFIKLPSGKRYRMKPVEEQPDTKQTLKEALIKKTGLNTPKIKPEVKKQPVIIKKVPKTVPGVVKLPTGTLIPVTLVNQEGTPLSNDDLNKVPITKIPLTLINQDTTLSNGEINTVPLTKIGNMQDISKLATLTKISNNNAPKIVSVNPVIRTEIATLNSEPINTNLAPKIVSVESLVPCQIKVSEPYQVMPLNTAKRKLDSVDLTANSDSEKGVNGIDSVVDVSGSTSVDGKRSKNDLASRSAASKRYRNRLREAMNTICEENKRLKAANEKLAAEKATLKEIILEHLKKCPNSADLTQYASKRYVSQT